MKYFLAFVFIGSICISCKSKKGLVSKNSPVMDTFYVKKVGINEIEMFVQEENFSVDGSWILQTIYKKNKEGMERVSLNLNAENKKFEGNDACNSYFGALTTLDKKKISFGTVSATERSCIVPALHAQPLYNALKKVRSYQCSKNYLLLLNENGDQLLQFEKRE